jgi:hypothetical protein
MADLRIERDGGAWYILDAEGLVRVADVHSERRAMALDVRDILQTGRMFAGFSATPAAGNCGAGERWAYVESRMHGRVATVWLPSRTRLELADG